MTAPRALLCYFPFLSAGLFLLSVNSPFHFLQDPAEETLPPEGVP